ncbi:MAG: rod shape-determining protein MreC [Firmicutes bacterium]|nr:rod shape-determining protein MreC [Clostridiales bacterium]MBQ9932086.1 rod shape-determining protein MreC [Bacillota bacterium]
MRWFQTHKKRSIFIIVLVVLLIFAGVSLSNQGKLSPISKGVITVSTWLQEPASAGTDGVANTIRGLFQFRKILAENEALKEEVADLKQEVVDKQLEAADLLELRQLSNALNYVSAKEGVEYVSADVIAMDNSDWFNIFTINVGTESGITADCAVLNGDGLIGRVLETGKGWSKVIGAIDEGSSISFRVLRDAEILGILSGTGKDHLEGYTLDPDASVVLDDVLVTSGLGIYPEGIVIGKVSEVTWDSDAMVRTLKLDPEVDFKNISKVLVVTDWGVPAAAEDETEEGGN